MPTSIASVPLMTMLSPPPPTISYQMTKTIKCSFVECLSNALTSAIQRGR